MEKVLAFMLVVTLGPTVFAADANPSWEKLKSLVGEWEGSYSGDGGPAKSTSRISYRLVSGGSALLETMDEEGGSQMVTLYHRDGATLLMTHYCAIGNQTRMRSRGLRDDALEFTFVDASNLKSKDDHRMSRLVMRFPAADVLIHEWTSTENGKDQVGRFDFQEEVGPQWRDSEAPAAAGDAF